MARHWQEQSEQIEPETESLVSHAKPRKGNHLLKRKRDVLLGKRVAACLYSRWR